METNLIRPENEKFRTFYASHIAFCDGNFCAAGLLDIFNCYHIYKLAQQKNNRKHNDIAEKCGDPRDQLEHLYQPHTQKELIEDLRGMFSINIVADALKLLVKKKIITEHNNPNRKYKFDKTTYYLFYPEVFNDWIKTNWTGGDPNCSKLKKANESGIENSFKPIASSRTPDLKHRSLNSEASNNQSTIPVSEKNIVDNSRSTILSSRSLKSEASMPQKPYHRSHRSEAAIYNIDFNKENNLNLNHPEIKNDVQEQTTGSVEVIFEHEKKIEYQDNQNLSSFQANSSDGKPKQNTQAAENHLFLRLGDIDERLTHEQEVELQTRFALLQEKSTGKISSPAALLQEIKFCLLDKGALTNCENNFHRKLCCIENMILKNQWRRPFKLSRQVDETHETTITKNNAAIEKNLSDIEKTLSNLSHEIQSDKELLASLPSNVDDDGLKDVIIKQNKRREEKIYALLAEKKRLIKNFKPSFSSSSIEVEDEQKAFTNNTKNQLPEMRDLS